MSEAKTFIQIGELVNWDKNPRHIDEEDKERLKKQLLSLGQYKPLIATKEGGYTVVLGGNMRLQAMRELVEEGRDDFEQVWVSLVNAPDEKRKLEYALSDNDRAGHYNEDELVELAQGVGEGFNLEDYKIDTAYTVGLDVVAERYHMADVRQQAVGGPEDRNTVKDKKVSFDNAAIKQIVLYFPNEEYREVIRQLNNIMRWTGTESNTEAATIAIREYHENHREESEGA